MATKSTFRNHIDALVVFGRSGENGDPEETFKRIDAAVLLGRSHGLPYLIPTGGAMVNVGGDPTNKMTEGDFMTWMAEELGYPKDRIVAETGAMTTIENLENVKPILERLGVRRVGFVSSPDQSTRIAFEAEHLVDYSAYEQQHLSAYSETTLKNHLMQPLQMTLDLLYRVMPRDTRVKLVDQTLLKKRN